MKAVTEQRHDRLIRDHRVAIRDALRDDSRARAVARRLRLPLAVVLHVKRQLPDSQMRAKGVKATLYSESDVKAALWAAQEKAPNEILSGPVYSKFKRKRDPSLGRIYQLHGSWNAALEAAGLPCGTSSRPGGAGSAIRYTPDDCKAALVACAAELGKAPSYSQYEAWARPRPDSPSGQTVRNRLGTWLEALAAAGF